MIATNPDSSQPDETQGDTASKSPRRGSRPRPLVLGMALGLVVALVAMLVFFMVARRGPPQLTREAYQSAVERWEKNGPADYDLDIELSGNRPGKIHVEVRGGEVVHMIRDGVEPSQKRTWDYWSVPGMLETIDQELEMARDPAAAFNSPRVTQMVMWAEFDPRLGYPRSYDRVVLGGDFEVHWKVTRFTAISAKN
jgi:hypothetical protein